MYREEKKMILSKIYCNQANLFSPILFNSKLNFIYADVKKPQNQELDSHNLGKTTLARILDFLFLAKKDKKFFLYQHKEFQSFVFFLEVKLEKNSYLTIKRSVEKNSKISLITHNAPNQDFTNLEDSQWDYVNLPIDQAKLYLDREFNLAVKSWKYRQFINYLIRTQDDFSNVFQLKKHHRSKDINWKPLMANLLGLNGDLAQQRYKIKVEIDQIKQKINDYKKNGNNLTESLSKIQSKSLLLQQEKDYISQQIASINFEKVDRDTVNILVKEIDSQIACLNMRVYSINNKMSHIKESLEDEVVNFDTEQVRELFDEFYVLFPDRVAKDYDTLLRFNQDILAERNDYLQAELIELQQELETTKAKLAELNQSRSQQLKFLQQSEILQKIKDGNNKIVALQAEIINLNNQKIDIEKALDLEKKQTILENSLEDLKDQMVLDLTENSNNVHSTLSRIRYYFNEITHKVLSKRGEIYVFLNKEKNLEFQAIYQDNTGQDTSESQGNTYQKLLCIAFDLAVIRTYIDQKFPKFIFIDGVFDGLDNRKKELLLEVLREYGNLGIQIISTTINSEVLGIIQAPIQEDEIVLRLHDNGNDGRLFKMPEW